MLTQVGCDDNGTESSSTSDGSCSGRPSFPQFSLLPRFGSWLFAYFVMKIAYALFQAIEFDLGDGNAGNSDSSPVVSIAIPAFSCGLEMYSAVRGGRI